MTFPDFPQYQDPILRRAFDQIDADSEASRAAREAEDAALIAELDAIGTDAAEAAPEPAPRQLKGTGGHFQDPDPDDPDVIIHEPKVTRFDKAMTTLRELEAQKAALPVDADVHSVVALNSQIEEARKKKERAESDVSRKQEGIDDWRKGAGREEYNASRRQREQPNADLSEMTREERARRHQDQRNDSKWRKNCAAKGMTEAQIAAAFVDRVQKRDADRAAKADEKAAEETMRALPTFNMF
jgi:hypothetical protein